MRRFPVGDVNGDGYNDFLTGGHYSYNPFGDVRLHLGGTAMKSTPDYTWYGSYGGLPSPFLGTGFSMGWCGDVNGDGIDDIMFSAYEPLENSQGRVYIYAGDTTLVNTVGANDRPALPEGYALHAPYPNPFNPSVTIGFTLPESTSLRLEVFDITGRRIETLFS